MKLNVRQIDTAKPKDKPYKLSDGGGLYLLINPNGSKYWRLKYRFAGKEKLLALGVYPLVTLASARTKRDDAKRQVSIGVDPLQIKKEEKAAAESEATSSFFALASEWHTERKKRWSDGYATNILEAFKKDVFPYIGNRQITEIQPLDLLAVLKKIEQRGATEKARKVRQWCGEVWRYAIVTGRAKYNPAPDLAVAMTGHEGEHFPFLMPEEMPDFYKALNNAESGLAVILAVRLIILVGLRPIEIRKGEWSEIDFNNALWEIPKEKMKKRRPHVVPLSRQALALLRKLKALAGNNPLIFPGRNDPRISMSESAMSQLILRIGYHGKVTGHGFRHTLSTVLYEKGYDSKWIEMQLAHADRKTIRGTYNHALYIDGRREMMQWYADYMENLEKNSR